MATVRLDRAQREAIRREIEMVAYGCGDIKFAFKPARVDREFVVSTIKALEGCVAMLDTIGTTEPYPAPEMVAVDAETELATWAEDQAFHLRRCLAEIHPDDGDLDALTGLQLVAKAGT